MGVLTLEQLREEIDRNLGSRAANLSSPDAASVLSRYATAINLVQKRIARKHHFQELNRVDRVVVTPTGVPLTDRYYEMPANTKEIRSLVWQDGGDLATDSVGHKLRQIPTRQWEVLVGTSWTLSTGTPTWYTRWANATTPFLLEFYPVPAEAGVLNRKYSIRPTDLTVNSDVSLFDNKDDLIIAWATEWLFQSLGEIADATRWQVQRLEMWDEAVKDDMSQPDLSMAPRGMTEDGGAAVPYWVDPFSDGE